MKNDNLKEKTTEKLQSELKTIKTITAALIGILTLLFIVTIYGLTMSNNKSTFIALIAVAISCSAVLPLQFSNMKKIKNELNFRETSKQL